MKYSVDIFDTFGNTDKLNILLELPNNFKSPEHVYDNLEPTRNQVKCVVSARGFSASALGIALFNPPNQETYYLQPDDWINENTGNIIDPSKQSWEYLDFVHPFVKQGDGPAVSYVEQKDYTNINEPINTKAEREIGECCLQTGGGNYFNKWTDLKRIQVETPAGYRVVQTAEPAMWKDTTNGAPMIWTEGKSETADTEMVQVKRHAEVDDHSWFIDCYMNNIDELCNVARNMSVSYESNGQGGGQWIVYDQSNDKNYIFLMINREDVQ